MSAYNRPMVGRGMKLAAGGRDGYGRDLYRPDPMLDGVLRRDGSRVGGDPYSEPLLHGLDPLSVQAQVIVIDPERRCRDYAEMFLSKLKKSGLICDITILDKFTSPSQVIDDATARGLLYTASVNLQNEMHQSVTINILQGQPQEHRNMPYEDALKLVSRHFDAHLLKLAGSRSDPVPAIPGTLDKDQEGEIEPELSLLLINLAEGKNLRLPDLDKVIGFLNKKRAKLTGTSSPKHPIPTTYQQKEKQNVPNLVEAPKPVQAPCSGSTASTQAEDLQDRINQLFGDRNKQQSTVGIKATTAVADRVAYSNQVDPKKKAAGIDFNNPSVQNALQNLLKTGPNLLDTIRSTATNTSTTPQSSTYGTPSTQISQSQYPSSNDYSTKNEDYSESVRRPAKRAKPGRHTIAGFF